MCACVCVCVCVSVCVCDSDLTSNYLLHGKKIRDNNVIIIFLT